MRGKELYEKITDIDDTIILDAEKSVKKRRMIYNKWILTAACFLLIAIIMPSTLYYIRQSDKNVLPGEVVVEINNKSYSVVNAKSAVYDNYNLEKQIDSQLVGDYIGESTVQIDNKGNKESFKLYSYAKVPKTQYKWYPRIIVQSSKGEYYHALIGSCFDSNTQTAQEVLAVYGLLSPDDVYCIESQSGRKVTDREFIYKFYNGLFTKEYGGNDFLQENVYHKSKINEDELQKLYKKYADDMVHLKVVLKNGLVLGIDFTSHNYVRADNDLYFKVDNSWLELVDVFK